MKNKGEQEHTFRILMDWPRLQVWTNEEMIQDLDVAIGAGTSPPARVVAIWDSSPCRTRTASAISASRNYRRRSSGSRSTIVRRISPSGLVSEGKPNFEPPLGAALHGNGQGHFATKEKFRDFELQMYVRHVLHHNSGVLFRTSGEGLKGRHYEIQLHDVEGAHYPTGSLYHYKRSIYPRIEAEKWWLFQMVVKDRNVLVRINGENVLEDDTLDNLEEGPIELQAHDPGRWTEFKQMQIRRLA